MKSFRRVAFSLNGEPGYVDFGFTPELIADREALDQFVDHVVRAEAAFVAEDRLGPGTLAGAGRVFTWTPTVSS